MGVRCIATALCHQSLIILETTLSYNSVRGQEESKNPFLHCLDSRKHTISCNCSCLTNYYGHFSWMNSHTQCCTYISWQYLYKCYVTEVVPPKPKRCFLLNTSCNLWYVDFCYTGKIFNACQQNNSMNR